MASSFIAILLLAFTISAKADFLCPFSTKQSPCNCTGSSPSATTFSAVECRTSTTENPFVGDDGTYTVDGGLNINLNAYSIRPNTFQAFKSIETLGLIQSNTVRPMKAIWDWQAFQGPKIQNFAVVNIAGVIPPHQASGLMQIAGTLQMIEFENCRENVSLGANDFSYFVNLKSFAIKDTPIRSIDDQAFNGMQSLTELYLINASLNNFPTKAASQLTKLVSLNVKNSNIQSFTGDDFKPLQDLATLELSGNNLQAAVNSGALDNIPQSVSTVILEDGNLDLVPASFTSKHPEVTILSMANNGIRALKNGDFSNGTKLSTLVLQGNPIATIEADALQYLSNVRVLNLYGSALVSLDLSVFKGMNQVSVVLDGSYLLKGLQVSDVSKFPQVITISARNAVLLVLDPNIGTLLANPNFRLDISENKNIDCNQDISWMAKYVLCIPRNLLVDNTQCTPASGGTSLYSYLFTKVPNACDVPSTTTTSTSTTTTTTTTTTTRTSSSGPTSGPTTTGPTTTGPTTTGPTTTGPTTTGPKTTGPTTTGPTTTGPTSTQKPATKSASSITASILATSMMVIFASVLKFF